MEPRKTIEEMLDDWIDEMIMDEGYSRDEIVSALELKVMAMKEEDGR